MKRAALSLFRMVEEIDRWKCVQQDDALLISQKPSQFPLVLVVWGTIGALIMAGGVFLPELGLYSRLGIMLFGGIVVCLVPILGCQNCGEWRLNSRGVEFHYFFRRNTSPVILHWQDVECLRMMGSGWAFRGKGLKVFIPFGHLSPMQSLQVKSRLNEILSTDFDLTIKPVPGRKIFRFIVAPSIGMIALTIAGFVMFRFYCDHPALHPIVRPIVVVWWFGLWFLAQIGLFIAHAIILNRQEDKDNPWRYRREHQATMLREYETLKN